MREDDGNGGFGEVGVIRDQCVWSCGERGCKKGGLVRVEGSDRKQSETNVQCEQIISTHPPSTTHTNANIHVSTVL